MFDLEKAIADWREQMRVAGIKTAVPLDELEMHLRESMERLTTSGMKEETAFQISTRQLGQPEALKTEFKKNERLAGKKPALFTLILAGVMILRVLQVHHSTGPMWKGDQMGWILFSAIVSFWAASTLFFNFKLGDIREVRLWKLAAIAICTFTVWISLVPMLHFLTVPRFNAAFGATDRILTLGAAATSMLSVFGWQYSRGILPVVRNRRTRTVIGIAGCLTGPALLTLFIGFIAPHLGNVPAPLFFVTLTWMWTAMAILAGAGYGLTEAAYKQTTITSA